MLKKILKIFAKVFCVSLLFLANTVLFAAIWYICVYGNVGFDSILHTLFGNIGGAEKGIIISYIFKSLIPAILFSALISVVLFYKGKRKIIFNFKKKGKSYTLYPFKGWVSGIISVFLSVTMILVSAGKVGFFEWLSYSTEKTTLYDENYIFPESTKITFPENKKNLIYIILESMETTFLSEDSGGAMNDNLIPELYSLAKENVSFSNNSEIGGWESTSRTSWTIASIVAQTSGMVLTSNEAVYDAKTGIIPRAQTLMDILNANGYEQGFMVGSIGSFANRDLYYKSHGCSNVYDLSSAKEDNVVPDDYYAWWGMEDKYLYFYAKSKITKMADGEKPFAFTMLTVDTHHVGGYLCSECKNKYDEQYSNVIACASKQLKEFVDWIKAQDFYKDTAIVITGDHKSMDSEYFKRNVSSDFDRRTYNCFINAFAESQNTKNRSFTPMDMFPTVLAAIGCKIEGERLALGTNLFSGQKTLSELYGQNYLNNELLKDSVFYKVNFLQKKFGE